MDSSVCIQAVEDNLVEAWACLLPCPRWPTTDRWDRIRYIGGIDFPLCKLYHDGPLPREELEERIRRPWNPSESSRLPVLVGRAGNAARRPGRRPGGGGIDPERRNPRNALALSKVGADTPTPTALTYREVWADADLDFWMEFFRSVFELPDFVCDFFRRAMKAYGLALPHHTSIILVVGKGDPSPAPPFFFSGKTAGIYNVGTLPDFQGAGSGPP